MIKLQFSADDLADLKDAREVPAYGIPLAAHYLSLPVATLRSWTVGRYYETEAGRKRFHPLLQLPNRKIPLLSFFNLTEAHVLSALRRQHKISLDRIRVALKYVSKEFGIRRPLIDASFETDGVDLFVRKLGRLIDASEHGQLMLKNVMEAYLRRIERENNVVVRLYPFTRLDQLDEPKSVLIDPRVAFGRPVLAGCRIPTGIIAERYKAGDSIEHLARDYDCSPLDIQEALRCELRLEAA